MIGDRLLTDVVGDDQADGLPVGQLVADLADFSACQLQGQVVGLVAFGQAGMIGAIA